MCLLYGWSAGPLVGWYLGNRNAVRPWAASWAGVGGSAVGSRRVGGQLVRESRLRAGTVFQALLAEAAQQAEEEPARCDQLPLHIQQVR